MELKIGEHNYRIGKLPAYAKRTPCQLHLSRRLTPLLATIGSAGVAWLRNKDGLGDSGSILAFLPVADALSKMPNDEFEYIVDACLSVCERQVDDGTPGKIQRWQRVVAPGGGLMFSDMDLKDILR